ncbi:hypothetical protein D0Z00_001884 [Geotrichum galactomycetum]|uniref:Uncharacterized protein n=1 Tax=Geotrichum galactomycetum TaxID=27317 RepID=A0ACB6V5P2_9ASCO|nr:hypothetical protein D0Z00_001884 [Geotrichum candidum]
MNLFNKFFVSVLAASSVVTASNVIDVDDKTFQSVVVDSKVPSLVEIYASWCGHCKRLAPIWEELADAYTPAKGDKKVQIVKIDGDINRKISKKYGVTGFPTLKLFQPDGTIEDVNVGRDFDSLSQFIKEKTGAPSSKPKKAPSAVVSLTNDNFDEIAYNKDKTVIVAFTASWCGHCKSLKPEYQKASAVFKNDNDKVIVAEVDNTGENTEGLKERFNIAGFPTILVFKAGEEEYETYSGGRKVEHLVAYLNEVAGLDRNVDGTLGDNAGRFKSLDAIAHKYVDAAENVRKELLEKISSVIEGPEATSAKIYKRFAEKINAGSVEYLEKEIKRLGNIISKGALKSSKLDELKIKLNILKTYLPGQVVEEDEEEVAEKPVSTPQIVDQHGEKPAQAVINDEL